MGIRHLPHVLTVPPTKACLLCTTPAGMDLYIYRSMPVGTYQVQSPGFLKIVCYRENLLIQDSSDRLSMSLACIGFVYYFMLNITVNVSCQQLFVWGYDAFV